MNLLAHRFRSFRSRLVVVFVGLFAVIQVAGFLAVAASVRASARSEIGEELRIASTLFTRQLDVRTEQLAAATRLVAGDFALKTAVATADHATTRSVLENHRRRVGGDLLMLVALDGVILADTLGRDGEDSRFPVPALLEQAEDEGGASAIVTLEGVLYRLAMVPVLAPVPIGWLVAGFSIDDDTASDLRRLTGLHISFVRIDEDRNALLASTLAAPGREALQRAYRDARARGILQVEGQPHVLHAARVADGVDVVLQRPLAEALAPHDRLLRTLIAIAGAGLVVALLGALLVARRVSRPVLALAGAARRVAAGDFAARVAVDQRDELGELAGTFNAMAAGLAERDRVRTELERAARLRRFFSPQLADALSADDGSALTSRRREISVVFCDLRGFTAFADSADPEEVMQLLRDYHAAVGPVIFAAGGTLERFTGDGLMVFFNDPLPCPDPAARAVRMAVAMRDAVGPLLEGWRRRGYAVGFGAGIAMGHATVGPIGFEGRFDYAAIGTVTNLSARLCQEAADGQILVSQRVHAEVQPFVDAESLGEVVLRGFGKPVRVFSILQLRPAAGAPARATPAPPEREP